MGETVRLALDAMPLIPDLHLPVDYSARFVAEGVLHRMFVESGDGAVPCAARSVTRHDGGRRWRVELDDTRRWSDGVPVTAEDAVRGATHALRRKSNPAIAFLATDTTAVAEHGPVTAIDPATVEYRFNRPIAFAPELLCTTDFAPRREATTANGLPVSLGPYAVDHWDAEQIVLVRNPFWPADPLMPDEVRFVHVRRPADAVARYLAGALDATATTGFGVSEVARLAEHPDCVRRPISVYGALDIGTRASGLAESAALRRSLGELIDPTGLERATRGLLLPRGQAPGDGAGPAALRRAFGHRIDIAYSAFAPNAEVATEVAGQLRAALGIPVTTTELSFNQYVRASISRDFSLLYTLTAPAFDHPAGALSDWRSTGRTARQAKFADPALDRLLDLAEPCADPAPAAARWRAVEDRWRSMVPRIPLGQVCAWFLRSPRIGGFELTPGGLTRFEQLLTGPA